MPVFWHEEIEWHEDEQWLPACSLVSRTALTERFRNRKGMSGARWAGNRVGSLPTVARIERHPGFSNNFTMQSSHWDPASGGKHPPFRDPPRMPMTHDLFSPSSRTAATRRHVYPNGENWACHWFTGEKQHQTDRCAFWAPTSRNKCKLVGIRNEHERSISFCIKNSHAKQITYHKILKKITILTSQFRHWLLD
jgi:hypothetical protein